MLISIAFKSISSKQFKCKPHPGRLLWSCDPTPDPSDDMIGRNEFPILCEDETSSLNGSITEGEAIKNSRTEWYHVNIDSF